MQIDANQEFAEALEHHQAGRLADAERGYRGLLERDPGHADALHLLGVIALQTGHPEPALALIERAIALRPDGAIYRSNLGQVLERLGRDAEAIRAYEAALDLDPEYVEAMNNLGRVLEGRDRLTEAEALYRKAIELAPEYAEPRINLGNVLKDRGDLDGAIEGYRQAIALRPDLSILHSNLLLTLHYRSDIGPADLAREHRAWADRHVAPFAAERRPHANDASPERRLRVGFVSPDFREHPVARFILPLMSRLSRTAFEVLAYADVTRPDGVTETVRRHTDGWRDVHALTDAQVAESIRADRVDILVDLAAHTGRNRLPVFARKPAPVSLTYLAYCSTTGVDAIDYRVTDRFLDPVTSDSQHYTERSLYLPNCYWCYSAPLPEPPSTERLPGPPTFGCLNNFAKITDLTLDLWMRLLERVPESRLCVHAPAAAHRDRIRNALRRAGLAEARATYVGRQPLADYLETYRSIDVGLDPHPYGGGTTTCDALWMGVPVISLPGRTAVSRAGSTLLENTGLGRLIARSEDEYVASAAALLRDTAGLADLRRGLRARLEASPVMDAAGFARDFEQALRGVWRVWCEEGSTRKGVEPG